MFKFERFNRFSEDLDFSLSYSERNNRKVVDMAEDLISESIKELERSITKKRKILVFESE